MIDVALASCTTLPEPDPDEAPLREALRDRGLTVATWAWDDPAIDWSGARLVLLRATWNYYVDRDAFLRWAASTAEVSALHNPLDVVAWNTHKRYLLDLARSGVAVVPTEVVERGGDADRLAAICADRAWTEIVTKPAVAAASFGAHRMSSDALDMGVFAALLAERDMLVQPYVESVMTHGERSIVVIDGEVTHSVRKAPRFGDDAESVTGPHPIADDDAALVEAAIAAIPTDVSLLYARVDVVRDVGGAPMVAELELTEPSLFFPYGPEALTRMADAIERLL
jgi:hypothetical protein